MVIEYFNASQRINRKSYMKRILITSLIFYPLLFLSEQLIQTSPEFITPTVLIPLFIISAITIYIQIIASINRARDIQISPYWTVILLLPIINAIYTIYLMFKKGITGNIKYEEKLAYEIISKEISNKTYPNGLWLKAYQKANGDEVKTKLEYIKLRITELNAKANEDVGKNAQEAVVLNRTSTNTIVIAMCAIATMTLAPWVAMYSLIEKNNSLSAKVNPIPFEFENSYTTRQCIISNFPTNLTLDEIENNIQREPENLGPYLQLVNYYLYSKNKDFTKAQEILNQRIKYKSKFYQHDLQTLANLYECGYGVKKDINRAIILYKEAEAYNQIAEIYTASKDITQDYEKAFEYAYKDTSPKLYKTGLARLYYFGIGTEKDLRESFKLQKQTIDGFNGRGISVHADDKLNIGLMYYYGFGTLKNDKKAIKYLKQAIEVEDNAPNSEEIKNRANQIIEKINNAN